MDVPLSSRGQVRTNRGFPIERTAGCECRETVLQGAIRHNGTPRVITLDGYAATHRAIRELKSTGRMCRRVRVRCCKYLNNVVEQDHRRVKQRIGPMLGFKRFDMAAITISGIELAEKIKKGQFQIGKLPVSFATAPVVWASLLAS